MGEPTQVIAGVTRFHAIDVPFTAALNDPELLKLARRARADSRDWQLRERVVRALSDRGVDRGRGWLWYYASRVLESFEPGMSVPICGMTQPGPAVPIEQARAMGLSWSQECAKKVGLHSGGRHPLSRCDLTGMRRAFRHTLDCATCWHVGVGSCEIFALIANREIDSDVDPRIEDLVA